MGDERGKLQIRFDMTDGSEPLIVDVPIIPFRTLRGFALLIDGVDLIRCPLVVHDPEYRMLHTICYAWGEEVLTKTVEW